MYDKGLFDKSPFDRQILPDNEIAVSVHGGVNISAFVCVRGATGTVVTGSWTISGRVGLRVPLQADIQITGDAEPINLFARTRLFTRDVTMRGGIAAAVGTLAALSADFETGAHITGEDLKARVRLIDISIHMNGGIITERTGLRVPLPGADISLRTEFDGDAGVRVPVYTREITITGGAACAPIFEPGSDKLELLNLNLAPGDELIIDTDVLEVLFNGVPDADFVTGDSEFFQLRPGRNRIIFMDGETARELSVSIVWSNRWL